MNYVKEMKAFYDRLEMNPLSAAAIALWHTLMHMNDKVGWVEFFTVAVPVLSYKSGLEEGEMVKARQELMDKGYLRVRSQSDQSLSVYTMVSLEKYHQAFIQSLENEIETKAEPTQSDLQVALESETELDHKPESGPESDTRPESKSNPSSNPLLKHDLSLHEQGDQADHLAREGMNGTTNCQLKASIKKVEFLNKTKKKEEQSFVRIVLNDMELHHDHPVDWNRLRPGENVTVSLDIGQTCPEQNSKANVNHNGGASTIHNDKRNAHNKGKGTVKKKSTHQPIEEWITIIEGDPEYTFDNRVKPR